MKQAHGPTTAAFTLLLGGCFSPPVPVAESGGFSETSGSSSGAETDQVGGTSSGDLGGETTGLQSTISGDTGIDDTGDVDTGIEPGCGNGIVEAGESCDDEEESATCDIDCTPMNCGDGVLNITAGEQCDDGGESAFCDVDCTPAICGDGVFNATAEEACDGAGSTASCNVDCSLASCGDGITNVTAGEDCDGGGETASCNVDCSLASCGDGITNVTAGEDCDDAGASAGCDEDCTVVVCGDATLNVLAGESCEAADLVGGTCEGLGFGVGMLACDGVCGYEASGCTPAMPVLSLSFSQVKWFDFSWAAVQGAEHYQVLESPAPGEPYGQLGGNIVGESVSFERPLHFRWQASYVLRACNAAGCTDSAAVDVMGSLAEAVGYVKASTVGTGDEFGFNLALSGDGTTLAVSALFEDSNATGIGGNQADNSASSSGAIYVFVRDGAETWSQQAYIKASNTGTDDLFGYTVALSGDGNTLAVGANQEDSNATGIGGNQANNSAINSGAVYVFVRDGVGAWSQQAYVKASNTEAGDRFGYGRVGLSADGNTLAVGADGEDSNATGIGGNQADNSASGSGAAYVFVRDGAGAWSQQAYVKASNTGANDRFGSGVALSGDGNTLAVNAAWEDSNATGIGGNQADNGAPDSGAVYIFVRDEAGVWSQQAYVKASNTGANDVFGNGVALSLDGNTLAVGTNAEDSNATGFGGNQADNSAPNSGAVYIFVRDGAGSWSQQAYVKASNTEANDQFSDGMALSGDGNTLAVGAPLEDSNATGMGGNQADNSTSSSGAVYVFVRDGAGSWSQQAYAKASNTETSDLFFGVGLSEDGTTLAVSGRFEDSSATGIGGNQADNSAANSGAVYLF